MSAVTCDACREPLARCSCSDGPETSEDGDRLPCPWCGHLNRDIWELGPSGEWEYDDAEAQCGECEKLFLVSRAVSFSYRAKRAEAGAS